MRLILNTLELAHQIVNTIEEKKGEDILLLDIQELSSIADYFIICTGTSERLLKTLADNILENVRKTENLKGRLEGASESGWIVIDLKDIVVHLFSPDKRNYYKLEELWSEGKTLLRLQ